MNKFKEENSLLTQAWVMEPKKKVQDILKELSTDKSISVRTQALAGLGKVKSDHQDFLKKYALSGPDSPSAEAAAHSWIMNQPHSLKVP